MAPSTLAGWIAAGPSMGLNPANYIPVSMYAQALASVQRNIKSASNPPSQAQYYQGQSMLICRGLIYGKQQLGDCGAPTQLDLSGAEITQGAGALAGGIASFAGTAIPGLGVAVQAITAIFQHHAQAVATEEQTICSVAQVINQVIPYYDAQVRAGNISPAAAKQGIQTFIAQVNAQLQAIYKPCNASCVYMSFLAAHADFLNYYYPAIAPVATVSLATHAPGAAPTSVVPTAPGGVVLSGTVGGNTRPTGTAGTPGEAAAEVAPSGLSSGVLIAIVVIVGIIILALAV